MLVVDVQRPALGVVGAHLHRVGIALSGGQGDGQRLVRQDARGPRQPVRQGALPVTAAGVQVVQGEAGAAVVLAVGEGLVAAEPGAVLARVVAGGEGAARRAVGQGEAAHLAALHHDAQGVLADGEGGVGGLPEDGVDAVAQGLGPQVTAAAGVHGDGLVARVVHRVHDDADASGIEFGGVANRGVAALGGRDRPALFAGVAVQPVHPLLLDHDHGVLGGGPHLGRAAAPVLPDVALPELLQVPLPRRARGAGGRRGRGVRVVAARGAAGGGEQAEGQHAHEGGPGGCPSTYHVIPPW